MRAGRRRPLHSANDRVGRHDASHTNRVRTPGLHHAPLCPLCPGGACAFMIPQSHDFWYFVTFLSTWEGLYEYNLKVIWQIQIHFLSRNH